MGSAMTKKRYVLLLLVGFFGAVHGASSSALAIKAPASSPIDAFHGIIHKYGSLGITSVPVDTDIQRSLVEVQKASDNTKNFGLDEKLFPKVCSFMLGRVHNQDTHSIGLLFKIVGNKTAQRLLNAAPQKHSGVDVRKKLEEIYKKLRRVPATPGSSPRINSEPALAENDNSMVSVADYEHQLSQLIEGIKKGDDQDFQYERSMKQLCDALKNNIQLYESFVSGASFCSAMSDLIENYKRYRIYLSILEDIIPKNHECRSLFDLAVLKGVLATWQRGALHSEQQAMHTEKYSVFGCDVMNLVPLERRICLRRNTLHSLEQGRLKHRGLYDQLNEWEVEAKDMLTSAYNQNDYIKEAEERYCALEKNAPELAAAFLKSEALKDFVVWMFGGCDRNYNRASRYNFVLHCPQLFEQIPVELGLSIAQDVLAFSLTDRNEHRDLGLSGGDVHGLENIFAIVENCFVYVQNYAPSFFENSIASRREFEFFKYLMKGDDRAQPYFKKLCFYNKNWRHDYPTYAQKHSPKLYAYVVKGELPACLSGSAPDSSQNENNKMTDSGSEQVKPLFLLELPQHSSNEPGQEDRKWLVAGGVALTAALVGGLLWVYKTKKANRPLLPAIQDTLTNIKNRALRWLPSRFMASKNTVAVA